MKTITQITEEKQDKVLQSPMLAQVIMKLKNAFLNFSSHTIIIHLLLQYISPHESACLTHR